MEAFAKMINVNEDKENRSNNTFHVKISKKEQQSKDLDIMMRIVHKISELDDQELSAPSCSSSEDDFT